MTNIINPTGKDASVGNSWKMAHYLGCAGAFYVTTLASTTIHELGHFMAAVHCKLRVYDFSVGIGRSSGPKSKKAKFFDKIVYRRTVMYNHLPIQVSINPIMPSIGHVKIEGSKSIRKLLLVSAAGPLLQALVMSVPYFFTARRIGKDIREKRDLNPFLTGVHFASGLGILTAFWNMLPQYVGTDGHYFFQELEAIASQRIL